VGHAIDLPSKPILIRPNKSIVKLGYAFFRRTEQNRAPMCDGVRKAPPPFPAHSLPQQSHYFSSKKRNADFVEEAISYVSIMSEFGE